MSFIDADTIAQMAERILTVDTQRAITDPFRLTPALRQLVERRLCSYRAATQRQQSVSGIRYSSSQQTKEALNRLSDRLRDGYRFLVGIPSFRLPESQRLAVLAAYGWSSGKLGNLKRKERLLELARQAIAITPYLQPELARYPDDLLKHLQEELAILDKAEPAARLVGRQAATKARKHALEELRRAVSRVRGYYISASDDLDKTPELAKVGLNPRRPSRQRRVPTESTP